MNVQVLLLLRLLSVLLLLADCQSVIMTGYLRKQQPMSGAPVSSASDDECPDPADLNFFLL